MKINNVRLRKSNELFDIVIKDGKFSSINLAKGLDCDMDLKGKLLMPPFIEPHIHLDTAYSAGEPNFNMSGTLFEGIEIWSIRKQSLTYEDVINRATKAIKDQVSNGVGYVRTHVDITDKSLIALKALNDLKEKYKNIIEIQIVAFPQEGIISYENGYELLKEAIKIGIDCIGAIPHFEYQRDWGVKSIYVALDLAKKHDLMVDVHCDEIDDEQSRFLEVVAAYAWEIGLFDKVTVSHTTAFGSYNSAYSYKLMRVLKKSKINFIANPLVNMNLGGRFDNNKIRRGLTPVKALVENKINVCFGHDDIYDPWYPLGNGNMLQVLHMGLHACHLLSYDDISNCLDYISDNSAKTLKINDYGIKEGLPATFIVIDGSDDYDIIRNNKQVICYYKNGNLVMEKNPSKIIKIEL